MWREVLPPRATNWFWLGKIDMEFKLDRLGSAFPTRVGIELGHLSGQRCRVLTKIFLVDHSVLVDHEAHHTGRPVACRKRNGRKASEQFAVDLIVVCSARRILPLLSEHSIQIAMKGRQNGRVGCDSPFLCCGCEQGSDRTQ